MQNFKNYIEQHEIINVKENYINMAKNIIIAINQKKLIVKKIKHEILAKNIAKHINGPGIFALKYEPGIKMRKKIIIPEIRGKDLNTNSLPINIVFEKNKKISLEDIFYIIRKEIENNRKQKIHYSNKKIGASFSKNVEEHSLAGKASAIINAIKNNNILINNIKITQNSLRGNIWISLKKISPQIGEHMFFIRQIFNKKSIHGNKLRKTIKIPKIKQYDINPNLNIKFINLNGKKVYLEDIFKYLNLD